MLNFTKPLPIIILIVGACFISSCSVSQKPAASASGPSVKLEEKSPQFLYQQLNDSSFKCTWFTGKLNADFEMDKKVTNFSASVRLRKDSLIWMSISAIGIEVVRALITKDSLKLLNKMSGVYQVTDYQFLDQIVQMPCNFEMIQQLLLGNYFSYVDIEKLKSSKVSKNNYVLSALSKKKSKILGGEREMVTQEIWMNPSYKINKMMVDDSRSKRELEINYADYKEVDAQKFPYKTEFIRDTKNRIRINLEYTKVVTNKPQQFPFVVPESYKKDQ